MTFDRYFTVEEANALVPALGRWLRQLRRWHKLARHCHREMELIKAVGHHPDGSLIMAYDFEQSYHAFERAVTRMNELIGRIRATGCQLKQIDEGLVDFPALLNGEEVLLCWRLGEPAVEYYHGLTDGFAGRRPIPKRLRKP